MQIRDRIKEFRRVKASSLLPNRRSDIRGYSGYRVGDDGSIWSSWRRTNPNRPGLSLCTRYVQSDTWRKLRLAKNRTGYLRAALFRNGKQTKKTVHVLMLETFVRPRPDGLVACHLDDDKTNNVLSNLRWDSPQANWADRKKNGKCNPARGEKHGRAKLTQGEVEDIRCRRRNGECLRSIADSYDVSQGTISMIALRKIWKHVNS